ncbi:MAG TPA: hypothetical protein VFR37_19095 [Longimicrobium sp.]|nr:hypothetical protein [Longimicrobium sp.]
MTALTPVQHEILRQMTGAVAGGGRIRYRTEYLGWLPFGQYQWVEVEHAGAGRPVPLDLPGGWELDDVLAIERAGRLRRVGETREAELDVDEIIYELVEGT